MREIKFRAWDKECEMMLSWRDLKYLHEDGVTTLQLYFTNQCPELALEQFTGLKDKNGVEIYESDIVEVTTIDNYTHNPVSVSKQVVSYNEKVARFDNAIHFCDVIVVGNIHQNPELLEKQQ